MINLQKGQKISLEKEAAGINDLTVGLGWDILDTRQTADLDAFAIMLQDGKVVKRKDVVYYGNLRHSSDSVVHLGDNLTGEGDGDDEQIQIHLSMVPPEYTEILIGVDIFHAESKKQDFGMIDNAFMRIFDTHTGDVICRYDLSNDFVGKTCVLIGKVYRHNNVWKVAAVGEGFSGNRDTVVKKLS